MKIKDSSMALSRRTVLQLSGAAAAAALVPGSGRDRVRILCLSEPSTFRPAAGQTPAAALERGRESAAGLSRDVDICFGDGAVTAEVAVGGGAMGFPRWTSSDIGPVHLICLETTGGTIGPGPLAHGGLETRWHGRHELGAEQLDWLARDLEHVPRSRPLVVCSHGPLREIYRPWNWAVSDGAAALELLAPFHVVVTLSSAPRRAALRAARAGRWDIMLPSLAHGWPMAPGFEEAGFRAVAGTEGARGGMALVECGAEGLVRMTIHPLHGAAEAARIRA